MIRFWAGVGSVLSAAAAVGAGIRGWTEGTIPFAFSALGLGWKAFRPGNLPLPAGLAVFSGLLLFALARRMPGDPVLERLSSGGRETTGQILIQEDVPQGHRVTYSFEVGGKIFIGQGHLEELRPAEFTVAYDPSSPEVNRPGSAVREWRDRSLRWKIFAGAAAAGFLLASAFLACRCLTRRAEPSPRPSRTSSAV